MKTISVPRSSTSAATAPTGICCNWYFPAAGEDGGRVKVTPDQMEKLYLSILRDIRQDYPRIDHAFVPVDSRLGQEMLRGPQQLLKAIAVGHVHPMHYAMFLADAQAV